MVCTIWDCSTLLVPSFPVHHHATMLYLMAISSSMLPMPMNQHTPLSCELSSTNVTNRSRISPAGIWPSSQPPGVIDSVSKTFIKHTRIIRVKELAICVWPCWVKGDYALAWCVGVDGEELSTWVAWVRHRSSREDLPFLSWKRVFLFTLGLVVRYRREKLKGCWGPEIRQEEESMDKFILPSWGRRKQKSKVEQRRETLNYWLFNLQFWIPQCPLYPITIHIVCHSLRESWCWYSWIHQTQNFSLY